MPILGINPFVRRPQKEASASNQRCWRRWLPILIYENEFKNLGDHLGHANSRDCYIRSPRSGHHPEHRSNLESADRPKVSSPRAKEAEHPEEERSSHILAETEVRARCCTFRRCDSA